MISIRTAFVAAAILVYHTVKCVSLTEFPDGDYHTLHEKKENKENYYIAAVVEYQPKEPSSTNNSNPLEILNYNAAAYKSIMYSAASQGAQIIVFPEYGLTSIEIPSHRELARPYLLEIPLHTNPCLSHPDHGVIRDLSCAAREFSIYLVVNLGEIEYCPENVQFDGESNPNIPNCPPDGRFQYNTNVVFDNNGTIISRYRKLHLYFEPQFNTPNPELVTFTTNFGVEFGMFICFDTLFQTPAVDLVTNGIKNFVYPTAWVDELPFLTAIQSQASWAFGANSNLLASGYHRPPNGQLGSGIYSGAAGAISYTFNPESGTKLIIAKVPNEPLPSKYIVEMQCEDTLHLHEPKADHYYLNEDLRNYTTKVLQFSTIETQEIICESGFCCQLDYTMENNPPFNNQSGIYRLAVLNGTRSVAVTDRYRTQICSIIRCFDDTLQSCSLLDRDISNLPNFVHFKLRGWPFIVNEFAVRPTLSTIDTSFKLIPYSLLKISIDQLSSVEIESGSLYRTKVQTIGITKIVQH